MAEVVHGIPRTLRVTAWKAASLIGFLCLMLTSASSAQTTFTLTPVQVADGPFSIVTIEGDDYIQSGDFSGAPARYMYFDVPAGVPVSAPVYLQLFFKDDGSGAIQIQYDATTNAYLAVPTNSGYNDSYSSPNSTGIVQAVFLLSSPYFQGRENNGADLRVYGPSGTRMRIKQAVLWTTPPPLYTAFTGSPWLTPYSGPERNDVLRDGLETKVLCGYQGWFNTEHDGASRGWKHWTGSSNPTTFTVDLWPDTSEYGFDELDRCDSVLLKDGSHAALYSPVTQASVGRHFRWMRDYDIDGVFLQRFLTTIGATDGLRQCNLVLANVRNAAHQEGRVWAVEYDISGYDASTFVTKLENDWKFLHDQVGVQNDSRYLQYKGKPVVGIWGLGFNDGRLFTPAQAAALIDFFHNDPVYGGVAVMGGVPSDWRTLDGDSSTDPAWASVYRSFDIIQPWAVGRYKDASGINSQKTNNWTPDVTETRNLGIAYLPTIFAGFSWDNLKQLTPGSSKIPRQSGDFLWKQVYEARNSGVAMVKIAMFDECDEGTAIYKISDTTPQNMYFVGYEGCGSDWYLTIAGRAREFLTHIPRFSDPGNLATNGDFSAGAAGYTFASGAEAYGWRLLLSGGASGSAILRSESASSGALGI